MPNEFASLMTPQSPTPERPLLGVTVLIVEDSRFASEALRLLCLRSGARIRRADTLENARKHLRVYRPTVVIVDLGLPDGSGAELIKELTKPGTRVDAVFGMSGDTSAKDLALEAGAVGFIEKPISSLGLFQEVILDALPEGARPQGLRSVSTEEISPDPIALHDDFIHISDILTANNDDNMLDYIAQFLSSIAKTAGDSEMEHAAETLAKSRRAGQVFAPDIAKISGLVQDRIAQASAL